MRDTYLERTDKNVTLFLHKDIFKACSGEIKWAHQLLDFLNFCLIFSKRSRVLHLFFFLLSVLRTMFPHSITKINVSE